VKQVGNTILAKGVNHILAKRDNSAWPKGSKLSGFSTCFQIAFSLDCARLGGKKYRSEARMIFFQPTAQRAVALPNQRRKATFASKK